ncbi:hypothetical protein CsatA_003996 [Cannabis sativa]
MPEKSPEFAAGAGKVTGKAIGAGNSPELLPAPENSSELALSPEKSPRNRFLLQETGFKEIDFLVIFPLTMPILTTFLMLAATPATFPAPTANFEKVIRLA